MKKLRQYFIQGLLVFMPLAVTIYVVYTVFIKIDQLFSFKIPGLGIVFTVLLIFVLGLAASNILTKKSLTIIELIFTRLPLVKIIYTAIKDLINAFAGDKKSFNNPVLVSLWPDGNTQAIGFMTRSSLEDIGIANRVAVYFPQSFNFAGNLLIVPSSQITPLQADPSDVMRMVVSGGISFQKQGAGQTLEICKSE